MTNSSSTSESGVPTCGHSPAWGMIIEGGVTYCGLCAPLRSTADPRPAREVFPARGAVPVDHSSSSRAHTSSAVRLENGELYVLTVAVDGELRDPWCFTQFLDAQVKLEQIKLASTDDPGADIQASIFKVKVVDQGREPAQE